MNFINANAIDTSLNFSTSNYDLGYKDFDTGRLVFSKKGQGAPRYDSFSGKFVDLYPFHPKNLLKSPADISIANYEKIDCSVQVNSPIVLGPDGGQNTYTRLKADLGKTGILKYKNFDFGGQTGDFATSCFQARASLVLNGISSNPNFISAGARTSGTTSISSIPWGAGHNSGDIGILVVESSSEPTTVSAGWNLLTKVQAGVPGDFTWLTIYWIEATSSSMAAVTVSGLATRGTARIFVYRGCNTANPIKYFGTNSQNNQSTYIGFPSVEIDEEGDYTIICIATYSNDAASNTASVFPLTTRDTGTGSTTGDGGGFYLGDIVDSGSTYYLEGPAMPYSGRYTLFAKYVSGDPEIFLINPDGEVGSFNLQTGIITGSSPANSIYFEEYADGWYRLELSFTISITGGFEIRFDGEILVAYPNFGGSLLGHVLKEKVLSTGGAEIPNPTESIVVCQSNIYEPDNYDDADYYDPDETYNIKSKAIYESAIYSSAIDSNPDTIPEGLAKDTPTWVKFSATNFYKPFDYRLGVDVSAQSPEYIEYTIKTPKPLTAISVHGLDAYFVKVEIGKGGFNLYSETINTNSSENVYDEYTWCTAPIIRNSQLVFQNIPFAWDYFVKVRVSKTAGVAKIGKLVFGYSEYFGESESPIEGDLENLSNPQLNEFDVTEILEGRQISTRNYKVHYSRANAQHIENSIKKLKGNPAVFYEDQDDDYGIIFGIVKSFSIGKNSWEDSVFNISVQEV